MTCDLFPSELPPTQLHNSNSILHYKCMAFHNTKPQYVFWKSLSLEGSMQTEYVYGLFQKFGCTKST